MPYKIHNENKYLINKSATKEWKEMVMSGDDLPLSCKKERMIKNGMQKRWDGMMKASGGDLAFVKAVLENAPSEGEVEYESRMEMLKMIEEKMDNLEKELDAMDEKEKLLMSPTLPGEWKDNEWVPDPSEFPSLLKTIVEEPTESES